MSITLDQHPQRIALANELHARPFQPATAPGRILHIAFKPARAAVVRDQSLDRAHAIALLDRFGAPHPPPEARHHVADLGPARMKWECHTEFVSYTLYQEGPAETLFSLGLADLLDAEWLASAPGQVIAAVQCELVRAENQEAALEMLSGPLGQGFAGESLATGWVLDGAALAAGDFRINAGGWTRFALIVCGETGPRRMGRTCQRLLEIEVYRTMAMLSLPVARHAASELTGIETRLGALIGQVASNGAATPEADLLAELTGLSVEIERLSAETAFRFSAARAYQSIVDERIEMLREERVQGRQQFYEFVLRRFNPAMRTVLACEGRLKELSTRAARAAELLRTRVNVVLESQNQALLESMDSRARLQLRLQQTVEGLSVVAISYYAVSLAGYLLAPLGPALQVDKTVLQAMVTLPVVLGVWWFVRRIRRRLSK